MPVIDEHGNVGYSYWEREPSGSYMGIDRKGVAVIGERVEGTVRWFKDQYGFIGPDAGGKDVFVHHSAIISDGYKTLKEGQRVKFSIVRGIKGPQAEAVEPA